MTTMRPPYNCTSHAIADASKMLRQRNLCIGAWHENTGADLVQHNEGRGKT